MAARATASAANMALWHAGTPVVLLRSLGDYLHAVVVAVVVVVVEAVGSWQVARSLVQLARQTAAVPSIGIPAAAAPASKLAAGRSRSHLHIVPRSCARVSLR